MPELTEITESAAAAVPSTSADNTEAKLEDAPSDTESEDTIPELEDAGENLGGKTAPNSQFYLMIASGLLVVVVPAPKPVFRASSSNYWTHVRA